MKGRIHSIETLGALDGPGLRCIIFLQGCPLRCQYCHNPDTWATEGGTVWQAADLVAKTRRYQPYFGQHGGITLSGGEPFRQAAFCAHLLQQYRQAGIHTAVDTSGFFLDEDVQEALRYTDLVILDLKHSDPDTHRRLTGQSLDNTLRFLAYVDQQRIPLWIRQVVVPGWHDTPSQLDGLADLTAKISSLEKVELLAYHTMGSTKWNKMKLSYPLEGIPPLPESKLLKLQAYLDERMAKKRKSEPREEYYADRNC